MSEFVSFFNTWISTAFAQLSMIGIKDVIDITIVSVLFYYVYKFIRDRRAGKLAGGLILLGAVLVIAELFGFETLKFIFGNIFQVGLLAIVIIFQPELRAALEKVGGESLRGISNIKVKTNDAELERSIDSLCDAVFDLSSTKTGALIVLENTTKLGDIIKTGVTINADLTSSLIKNIFFNKAPLHDGAMVIRDLRIHSCGCFLPLTENTEISKDLGTRHRAALGMSEASDSKVIVVSEESGIVSVAFNGKLTRRYDRSTLKNELMAFYSPANIESKIKMRRAKKQNP